MRLVKSTIVATILATTALSTAVYAVEKTDTPEKAVQQDFSKLSKDGFKAFQNVREARLAIFNGNPDEARKDVNSAMQALESAKTDNTAFMKAEADLKQPAEGGKVASAKPDAASGSNTAPSTTPVKWLPINGSMSVNEDFTAFPAKVAGVKKANDQLKAGQRKEALETLKLNDVNVAVTIEAAPLDATVKGVDQASQLIDTGKYYEANKALMGVENGIRYYVADAIGAPAKTTAAETHHDKAAATTGAGTNATPAPAPATAPKK